MSQEEDKIVDSTPETYIVKTQAEQWLSEPRNLILTVVLTTIMIMLTGIWQLSIIAGMIGGFFAPSQRQAWQISGIGILISWLILILIAIIRQPVLEILSLIFEFMTGSPGLGIIGVILSLLVAFLLGFLSGIMGFLIRKALPIKS